VRNASGCICEVIIFCVVFTTQDFRIKEKNGANFFISSKHCTIAGKKKGHQVSVSFEKFDVVQALLSFFLTLFQLTV
jgi:hypothetical protein